MQEPTEATTAAPMAPRRIALVFFLAAVIILAQGYDTVAQKEHWPFSNYPMYARATKHRETSLLRLYGRVTDGQKVWVQPIVDRNDFAYVPPLTEIRMKNVLDHTWGNDYDPPAVREKSERAMKNLLRDYMAMYEEGRVLGAHNGPQMLEAILVRLTWKLDAAGGTVGKAKTRKLLEATAFPPAPSGSAATLPSSEPVAPTEDSGGDAAGDPGSAAP